MKLIEDLGCRSYGTTGQVKRYGLYECPNCMKHYEARVDHVKSGRTTQCKDCAMYTKNTIKNLYYKTNFTNMAILMHGNKYSYEQTTYVNTKTKVGILCNTCDTTFSQKPAKHLAGHGCPTCAREANNIAERVYSVRPTTLYYVYFKHINMWKVGCTSIGILPRFKKDNELPEILYSKEFNIGGDAYRLESIILKKYKEFLYKGPAVIASGNSELFTTDILHMFREDYDAGRIFQ